MFLISCLLLYGNKPFQNKVYSLKTKLLIHVAKRFCLFNSRAKLRMWAKTLMAKMLPLSVPIHLKMNGILVIETQYRISSIIGWGFSKSIQKSRSVL